MQDSDLLVSFYDFDQTLTVDHTFRDFGLSKAPSPQTKEECFAAGKAAAKNNSKEGINKRVTHQSTHISAIATYHNNPDFIAGFISGILGKELTLVNTLVSDKIPVTAINYYQIPGEKTPFLISYIPAYGTDFNNTLMQLRGKNEQILHLRKTLLEEKHITPQTRINFYDDTQDNFEKAASLPFIDRYWVNKNTPKFSILQQVVVPKPTEHTNEIHSPPPSPQPKTKPISAHLFMQIISSTPAKVVGGLLLVAGLAALTAGTLGIMGVISGLSLAANIACIASGTTLAGVMSFGLWAGRKDKSPAEDFSIDSALTCSI